MAAHFIKPSSLTTCFHEKEALDENMQILRKEKKPVDLIPMTIISRDPDLPLRPFMSKEAIQKEREEWQTLHNKQHSDMKHATFLIVKHSSHLVQLDCPDTVIQAIQNMLQMLKK